MRPSFLMGNRKEKRAGEKIGIFLFKLLTPLFLGPLKKMKPIHSEKVAKAMINVSKGDFQQTIFESNEIKLKQQQHQNFTHSIPTLSSITCARIAHNRFVARACLAQGTVSARCH